MPDMQNSDAWQLRFVLAQQHVLQANGKQGSGLDAAIICQCSGVPWARVRKQIKYKTCYSPNMVDPKNDEFKDAKSEVEEAVISTHLLSTKIRSSIGNIDKQFL